MINQFAKKTKILGLLLFLCLLNLNLQGDLDSSQSSGFSQDDISKVFGDLNLGSANLDNLDLDDSFLDFCINPNKMAEKLPKEYKDRVINCQQICQQAVLKVHHPTMFLVDIANDLDLTIQEASDEKFSIEDKEFVKSFCELMISVKNSLGDQEFQAALMYGYFSESLKTNFANIFEELKKIDIEDQNCLLNKVLSEEQKEKFIIIKQSMKALKNSNIGVAICYKQKCLQADLILIVKQLKELQKDLQYLKNTLAPEDQKEVIKAVDFWKEALNEFNILQSFAGIKDQDKSIVRSFKEEMFYGLDKIYPILLGGYALYRKASELYQNDNPGIMSWSWKNLRQRNNLSILFGDQVIRMIAVPIYFLHRFNAINKSNEVNPLFKTFLLKQMLFEFACVYSDPNFFIKQSSWPLRALFRVGSASGYFYLKKHFPEFKENQKIFDLTEQDSDDIRNDINFRRSVWFSCRDGYRSFAGLLENMLQQNLSRQDLRVIENKTLGFIKPEFISFMFNTFMPVLACEYFPKDIANLKKKDIFAKEFNLENIFDWNYIGDKPCKLIKKYVIRDKNGKERDKQDGEKLKDGEKEITYIQDYNYIDYSTYIKNRFLGYSSLALGSWFGKKLASRYRAGIKRGCSNSGFYFLKFLNKIGLVSQESLEQTLQIKTEFKNEMVGFLSEMDDSLTKMFLNNFLMFFVSAGFLTQLDAANFEAKLTKIGASEEELSQSIDELVSTIVDLAVIEAGGYVGAWAGWLIVNCINNNYDNIKNNGQIAWDKVRNYFA